MQFTLDLRQANRMDASLLQMTPVTAAPRRPLPPEGKPVLKAALELGKSFDPKLALLNDVTSVAFGGATNVLRPATAPPAFAISRSAQMTMALGLTGSGFVIYGAVGSIGLYASTTREIGGYFSSGVGLFLPSVGASGGGEFTVILGTPTDLSGAYFSAGVSVAPNIFGVGAALLFSPGPPLTLMGLTVSLTANTPSFFPVSITLEVTDTRIKPLLRF